MAPSDGSTLIDQRIEPVDGHDGRPVVGQGDPLVDCTATMCGSYRDITAVIGRRLDLPVESVTEDTLGPLGPVVATDQPCSSAHTRESRGWGPTHPDLLVDRALAILRGVRAQGVGLSLDEFGTGYCSPNYLRQFPFDTVRVDRSFIPDLPADAAVRALVTAIVDLDHAIGLTVIAEGVETRAERDQVTILGVDQVQGHLLAHPLPVDQLDPVPREHEDLLHRFGS